MRPFQSTKVFQGSEPATPLREPCRCLDELTWDLSYHGLGQLLPLFHCAGIDSLLEFEQCCEQVSVSIRYS